MSGIFGLALRHLLFQRFRSCIIVACLTLVLVMPLTANVLLSKFQSGLLARGQSTPLLLGSRGSRVDLVLKSLYFDTDYSENIVKADSDELRDMGFGPVLPLHLRHRVLPADTRAATLEVEDAPLVGTDPAYLQFRGLVPARGSPPLFIGDAVLGAGAATRMGLDIGDYLMTRPESAYNPDRSFQLKMPVVGVLAPTGTPDDEAAFTDIKTAWVVDGIGHGHEAVDRIDDPTLVERDAATPSVSVATPKLARLREITPENRGDFHFHGDTGEYPVTAAILVPRDGKARTIALARYGDGGPSFLVEPTQVIEEVLGLVVRVKRFYDANLLLVTTSTVLFMALIITLSAQLRRDEMATLHRLGAPRGTVFWLQAWEILLLLLVSAVLATGAGLAVRFALESYLPILR